MFLHLPEGLSSGLFSICNNPYNKGNDGMIMGRDGKVSHIYSVNHYSRSECMDEVYDCNEELRRCYDSNEIIKDKVPRVVIRTLKCKNVMFL